MFIILTRIKSNTKMMINMNDILCAYQNEEHSLLYIIAYKNNKNNELIISLDDIKVKESVDEIYDIIKDREIKRDFIRNCIKS